MIDADKNSKQIADMLTRAKAQSNAEMCLDCGYVVKLTRFQDGTRCERCGGKTVPVYIGIDTGENGALPDWLNRTEYVNKPINGRMDVIEK